MALSSPEELNKREAMLARQQTMNRVSLEEAEVFALLENAVPLEAPRVRYVVASQPIAPQLQADPLQADLAGQVTPVSVETAQSLQIAPTDTAILASPVETAVIKLLDERLVINRRKRKTGEVVVRKEIETIIVEVPIRREKLIVEQISPEYKQLAVVDLGQAQVAEQDLLTADNAETNTAINAAIQTSGDSFANADAAIQFLEAMVQLDGSQPVQVSLVFADDALQTAYQQWLKRHSAEAIS